MYCARNRAFIWCSDNFGGSDQGALFVIAIFITALLALIMYGVFEFLFTKYKHENGLISTEGVYPMLMTSIGFFLTFQTVYLNIQGTVFMIAAGLGIFICIILMLLVMSQINFRTILSIKSNWLSALVVLSFLVFYYLVRITGISDFYPILIAIAIFFFLSAKISLSMLSIQIGITSFTSTGETELLVLIILLGTLATKYFEIPTGNMKLLRAGLVGFVIAIFLNPLFIFLLSGQIRFFLPTFYFSIIIWLIILLFWHIRNKLLIKMDNEK